MAAPPLVSCIMPTRDRRPFVGRAIRYFLGQDYEPRELVIVDDGRDVVADLVPSDPRIRYLRRTPRRTVGAKRNLACAEARGEIILHWDDDDWMAPWRVRYQVEHLLDAGADICGVDRVWYLDPASAQAWRYVHPGGPGSWLVGGTICYRKSLWQRRRFANVDIGEDNRFIRGVARGRVLRLENHDFYVALMHPGNTSLKRPRGRRWRRHRLEEIVRVLGDDAREYLDDAAVETESRPLPPAATAARRQTPAVVVSLPSYENGATLRRAVDSILGQTWRDLQLVVVNDGGRSPWPSLSDIDDPRLVRFDLAVNRGRYFADAVVLAATRSPFYLIQDADDWSDRRRLAILMRHVVESKRLGAVSAIRTHRPGGAESRGTVERYPAVTQPLTDRLTHRACHAGLYRTEALRAIGGYYGGFRIGYDTLLVNLLLMTGNLAYVDQPLYHRVLRADSLSNSPATGMRSTARLAVGRKLQAMYRDALALRHAHRRGELTDADLARGIRTIAARHVAAADREAIGTEAARLRPLLERGRAPEPATTGPLPLSHPRLTWSGWSITRTEAALLRDHLDATRPRRILEVGSGTSTAILADYARRHHAALVSLEHQSRYLRQTHDLLCALGLRAQVELTLAPLAAHRGTGGDAHVWYSCRLRGPFDFVLIDGPPKRHGRQAALFALAPLLPTRWRIWLHDAFREHERACVELWARHFRFDREMITDDARGFLQLRGTDV